MELSNEVEDCPAAEALRKKRLAYFSNGKTENKTPIEESEDVGKTETKVKNRDAGGWDDTYSNRSAKSSENFDKIKEQLKQEALTASEDGYNELVEKLIQSAKKDIIARERRNSHRESKHSPHQIESPKPHVRRDSGSLPGEFENFKEVSDSLQNKYQDHNGGGQDVVSKSNNFASLSKSEKSPRLSRSSRTNNKLAKSEAYVEDLFSNQQKLQDKKMIKDSHEFENPNIFQKSVDFDHLNNIGLETHRPESERSQMDLNLHEHVKENDLEGMIKQMSPRVMEDILSNDLKYALGEQNYRDFLRKSVTEIDKLQKENLSDRSSKNKSKTIPDKKLMHKPPVDKKQLQQKNLGNRTPRSQASIVQNDKSSSHDVDRNLEIDRSTIVSNNSSLTEITRTETEASRSLLNRPKYDHIKPVYDTEKDDKHSHDRNSVTSSKNYEQITVPRNVVFSASQIYEQAYQKIQPQAMPAEQTFQPGTKSVDMTNGSYQGPTAYQQEMMNQAYFQQQMMMHQQQQHQQQQQMAHSFDGMQMHPFYHNYQFPGAPPPGHYPPPPYMHPQFPPGAGQMYHVTNGPQGMNLVHPEPPSIYDPYQPMSYRSSYSLDSSDVQRQGGIYPNQGRVPHPPEMKPRPPSVSKPSTPTSVHGMSAEQSGKQAWAMSPGRPPHLSQDNADFSNYLQSMSKGMQLN